MSDTASSTTNPFAAGFKRFEEEHERRPKRTLTVVPHVAQPTVSLTRMIPEWRKATEQFLFDGAFDCMLQDGEIRVSESDLMSYTSPGAENYCWLTPSERPLED